MKVATLKLCLPVVAMTAQQSAAGLIIPPFLYDFNLPVSVIGSLVSLGPILALSARLPAGLAYRKEKSLLLIGMALSIVTLSNFLYSFTDSIASFAVVHLLNGFTQGAATTLYLAFFVDALPPDEERHHAMGYYTGGLAIGHSSGGLIAGYLADRLGYVIAFRLSALLGALCLTMLFVFRPTRSSMPSNITERKRPPVGFLRSLHSLVDPRIATIVVVALFLNLVHQLGTVFLPLYGLAVGLSLTQVGVIKGIFALCNAITRPLSGPLVARIGHQKIARAGFPLQSAFMMLVPLFHDFASLLTLFIVAGFLRGVVLVSNTISMVEDVDEKEVGRGVASGVFHAAGDVGNVLGPSTGGVIASIVGITRLFFVGPLIFLLLFFAALWACKFVAPSTKAPPVARAGGR